MAYNQYQGQQAQNPYEQYQGNPYQDAGAAENAYGGQVCQKCGEANADASHRPRWLCCAP